MLGLAGVLAIGISSEVKAQEFPGQNENAVDFSAFNSSFIWSYGCKVDICGADVEVIRGFTDRVAGYFRGGVANPVINEGFRNPNNKNEFYDLSPNNFIGEFGIGGRGKFFESDTKDISICGGLEISKISEFEDRVNWNSRERSEFHIDGITSLDGDLWAEKKYKNLDVRAGVNVSCSYCQGEALTYTPDFPDGKFTPINWRNKTAVNGLFGADYKKDDWIYSIDAKVGKGFGIEIGVGKKW